MHSLTPVGVIILVIVVLAGLGGWASSGTTRLGRELGFLGGLLVGILVALAALPFVNGPLTGLAVLLGIPLVLGLGGASLLGEVGLVIAHGLYRARLGLLDRLLGALLSLVGAVLLCVVALHVLLLLAPHRPVAEQIRHDSVASWLIADRAIHRLERTI
jgi:hypothetical protein